MGCAGPRARTQTPNHPVPQGDTNDKHPASWCRRHSEHHICPSFSPRSLPPPFIFMRNVPRVGLPQAFNTSRKTKRTELPVHRKKDWTTSFTSGGSETQRCVHSHSCLEQTAGSLVCVFVCVCCAWIIQRGVYVAQEIRIIMLQQVCVCALEVFFTCFSSLS